MKKQLKTTDTIFCWWLNLFLFVDIFAFFWFIVPALILHLEKTIIVTKGGSTTLFCNVSWRPPPSVTWTHIDSGKRVNNRTWVIDNIEESDLGKYQCDASNIYGNATDSTKILFEGRCLYNGSLLYVLLVDIILYYPSLGQPTLKFNKLVNYWKTTSLLQ